MKRKRVFTFSINIVIVIALVLSTLATFAIPAGSVKAAADEAPSTASNGADREEIPVITSNTPQVPPLSQNWSNTGLITANDDWSAVPGIMGYLGDYTTASPTGVDPQTLLSDYAVAIDVIANQTNPNTLTAGGVAEFEITNPVVALQGSGTADAPFITIYVDGTGYQDINIAYSVRDIDGSADNAVQQVALHYRLGSTGDFTNLPAGYIADATTGPNLAEMVTPINVTLPAIANNQPLIMFRIMTTNAVGSDEWVGIDDISVTGIPLTPVPEMQIDKTGPGRAYTNHSFDYTLSVINSLGFTADQVVITDSLPANVTFQSASDGGVLVDTNVVSWTVSSLADGASAVRTVTVAAPANETTLVNSDYRVWASNWITPTLGDPVTTTVIDPDLVTPIANARAEGAGWYGTIQGNVTVVPGTFAARSFAIQDGTGGIYVYPASNIVRPPMVLGDVLRVKGTIKNYNGLLEIDPVESIIWIDSGTAPAPLGIAVSSVAANQGKLVTIQGTALSMSGTTNKTINFQDGSGTTTVYVYGLTGINTSSFTFPMPMRVTGMDGAYNTPQVNPRYQSDIVDLRPPAVTGVVPANGAIGVSPYKPLQATFSKAMDPETLNNVTFLLADMSGPLGGSVTYAELTKTASFMPNAALNPSTTYTATLTTGVTDQNGTPLASTYVWSFTTGEADLVAPAITGRLPIPDETNVSLRSSVVISFTEDLNPASLDNSHFILQGPYGDVPNSLSYNPSTFVVRLAPETRLLPTTLYTVIVKGSVADWAGNTLGEDSTWSFETSIEPPMSVYFGDLHNHTSYSDGAGTPAQALASGEAAGFDFMAISDHSYAIDDAEWANTLDAVNNATNPNFLALRGFEYTQGAEGHINVYNTVRHAVRTDTGCAFCDYTPNLEPGATVQGFYQWAASEGLTGLDEAGTVMQFNHPGWISFNDWTYHPEVSDIARLEEVGNGNGTSYAFSEDQYIRSLDYGWRVGATNNADTHTVYWGINTDHRTGVLMTDLSKDSLLEALRERRTFATEDKNFELKMKANGVWMGSEIANSGSIQFEIDGNDPDGELTSLVQIITDQGKVAAEYQPGSASFTWTPVLDISTGVHFFYVRVTQADGDRIVSSPVWTLGSEDISITDLVIEPTIPTIYNPSLITVRVTNRNTQPRTVTVSLDVNGNPVGTPILVTVPGNGDAFANFSWQPGVTGPAVVTAVITGTPAGDNPDDNSSVLNLTVTDEQLPLILIDAAHGNLNATGNEMQMFVKDLSDHRYNVLKNLDELTTADLNPAVVKLLMITAPQYPYTGSELDAISNYIAAGGSLWLVGMSDYPGSTPWAATVADRENAILADIEAHTGAAINMRLNDDEIIDANDNNGYMFGPIWSNFPSEYDTSIGINVEKMASWSVASLRGRNPGTPLTAATPGVQIVVQGDLETGYTQYNTYWDPNHTSNEDADGAGDAYIYNPTWVYPNDPPEPPADAIPVPMAAVTQLPGGAGRILLYGDSNDAFTTYAYTAGDGKQNELFNLEAVMWLTGEPLHKSTIAEARAQSVLNQPDNLDKLVWVEGEITAAYGEFFNVLYVQDETGGITVHAPAGDIDPSAYTRGTHVRVVGTVGIYNGDTEIEFFEAEMVQVIEPATAEPAPLPMTTQAASLEENQGWLSVITGTVTTKVGSDNLFVDDGSGPVRIFLDGYNGDFNGIQVNDLVRVTGLVSEDGDGQRIRVRNYLMHSEYDDDVVKLPQTLSLGLAKTVATPETVLPGSVVTYTLVLSNTGSGTVLQVQLTDSLPAGTTFGSFVEAGGAQEQDGTISWSGTVYPDAEVKVIFTANVDKDYDLYGETITNLASFTTPYAGSGNDTASFTIANGPNVTIGKSVAVPYSLNPGDVVTYTLSLNNVGESAALDLAMTDTLPEGLTFGEWLQQDGAVESDGVITWDGDLSGGKTFIFTALVDYDASGYGQTITNEVEYTSLNAGYATASANFTIGTPELSIAKTVETGSDPAMPGETVTYTLVLHNSSLSGAVGVHIWDVLPQYLEGNDADVTTNISSGAIYTLTIPATLALDVPLGITIDNTAYFENGSLTGESSASFDVWAGEALLSITKTVQTAHTPALPGDPITYTIEVSNDGSADAAVVHVRDILPDYVIGEDLDTIVSITKGTSFTAVIPATLAGDVPVGITIDNTAYFESSDQSGDSTASFDVWGGEALLSITKSVQTAHTPALPGDPITYTIEVRNDGTAGAVDVHIWDVLPEGVVGEDVNITATIPASTAYTVTIPAALAAEVVRGTMITNTAYFTMGNQTGEASVVVLVAPYHRLFLPLLRK